jgi:hypothetical protein
MRPSSIIEVSKYNFAPIIAPKKENFSVNLVQGGMRSVTGKIAKTNPENYKITSSVATMGVRGTDFSLAYAHTGAGGLFAAINRGIITITNNTGTVELNSKSSYRYAYVASMDSKPELLKSAPQIFKNDISIQPVAANTTGGPTAGGTGGAVSTAAGVATSASVKTGSAAAVGAVKTTASGVAKSVTTTTIPGSGTYVQTSAASGVGKSVTTTTAAGVQTTKASAVVTSVQTAPQKILAALNSNFYVGGGLGGDFLTFSGSSTNNFSNGGVFTNSFSNVISPGANVRLLAGYQYINHNASLGAEIFGFYSSAEADAKLGQPNAAICDFHVHTKDTFGAVIVPGYIFSKYDAMLYGHIGWVTTNFNINTTTTNLFDTVQLVPFSIDQRINGLDLGIGGEFPIDQHLAIRVGYDYMRYPTINKQITPVVLNAAPLLTKTSSFSIRPTDNQINCSLLYHFS